MDDRTKIMQGQALLSCALLEIMFPNFGSAFTSELYALAKNAEIYIPYIDSGEDIKFLDVAIRNPNGLLDLNRFIPVFLNEEMYDNFPLIHEVERVAAVTIEEFSSLHNLQDDIRDFIIYTSFAAKPIVLTRETMADFFKALGIGVDGVGLDI